MKYRHVLLGCSAALATFLSLPTESLANPKAFPFTYTYPTLAKGDVELEQYVDLIPVKALSTSTGKPTPYLASQFITELEIGITDRLELGLYASFVPRPGETFASTPILPNGNGAKQRLRYRFAEEGQWPIDLGIYGEIAENEREIEFEAKIHLARRVGSLLVAANLSGEYEMYFSGEKEFIVNPSAGMSYQVTPSFNPGIEYWARAEFPTEPPAQRGFNLGPHHYVGPTMMFNFGRAWWSTGVYFHMSDLGYVNTPGDAFGPIWFRTVLGVGL